MAHISRHELKRDELKSSVEHFEDFVKTRTKDIATFAGIVLVVAALAGGLKIYQNRQESAANAQLGEALRIYRAYVGTAPEGALPPGTDYFPNAQEKYLKALGLFQGVVNQYARFPQPKAVAIARYHAGLCQAQLGQHDTAVNTLEEGARDSDPALASLARFALAGEFAANGKINESTKIYEDLAQHPTPTVPEATARLALADAYRSSQPAKAREIYQQLEKKFGSDATLAQLLKDQIASLPQ